MFQQRLHLSSREGPCRKTKHYRSCLPGSLGFSLCINCNFYRYNCKYLLRIFLTIDSGTCSSQPALGTEFLGLGTKRSWTLSTVSLVVLGLPAQTFPWWHMQPLSWNCSYYLQINDAGRSWSPNWRRNTCQTTAMLLLHQNSSTHQLRSIGMAATLSNWCTLVPQDSLDGIRAISNIHSLCCIWH